MFIGIERLELRIPACDSLKAKRHVGWHHEAVQRRDVRTYRSHDELR